MPGKQGKSIWLAVSGGEEWKTKRVIRRSERRLAFFCYFTVFGLLALGLAVVGIIFTLVPPDQWYQAPAGNFSDARKIVGAGSGVDFSSEMPLTCPSQRSVLDGCLVSA